MDTKELAETLLDLGEHIAGNLAATGVTIQHCLRRADRPCGSRQYHPGAQVPA
jgi:hypothetical protein